jgi:hypothetical protein
MGRGGLRDEAIVEQIDAKNCTFAHGMAHANLFEFALCFQGEGDFEGEVADRRKLSGWGWGLGDVGVGVVDGGFDDGFDGECHAIGETLEFALGEFVELEGDFFGGAGLGCLGEATIEGRLAEWVERASL